ncbi:transporter substrate-binding domain-containing protein [Crenothrix polyspora]|uniref:Putative L-arginine-binding protein n=1 Tax=Crenothrix polyspora TaxID=360316 RepID=A0A1R4HAD7_9GAMM|nr:transporter substrate-binding domain-containing protein [Crenothrix polyspora]SJM93224.1 putative L-arginine-binding protein [Crenothrix polyspora]
MANSKALLGVLALCLTGMCSHFGHAEETSLPRPSLYIGIENNRKPYVYFDANRQAQGFLVTTIQSACEQLDLKCHFVGGRPENLLLNLQNIKLNAVLLLDSALPPKVDALKLTHPPNIDHLKFTKPLCQLVPVLLHKKQAPARTKPEDFKNTTIGVQEGTVFHSYLVAKYSGVAHIKAYPLLESAIIDLVFNRLDGVLGEKTFFKARVFDTLLDEYAELTSTPADIQDLSTTRIVLAVREHDTDLLKQLNAALAPPASTTKACTELLASASVKPVKSNH